MSINITVHGSPVKCSKQKNFLIDEERAKKDLIDKRRKLRLEQVRQQSKNIACCVRQNVEQEKQKQLERINDIKEQELKKWREKKIAQKENEFTSCLVHVGLAHRAANAENEEDTRTPCTCSVKTNKWNEIRPTKPTPKKRKISLQQKQTYKQFCKNKLKKKQKQHSDKENLSDSDESNIKQYQKDSSLIHHLYPNVKVKTVDVSTTTDDSLYGLKKVCNKKESPQGVSQTPSADLNEDIGRITYKIKPLKPRGRKSNGNLVKTPSVILAIDSECELSDLNIEDIHESENMKFSRISSREKPCSNEEEQSRKDYVASDYKATDSSSEQQICFTKTRFTQISDLIKQQDDAKKKFDVDRINYEEDRVCSTIQKKSSPPKKSSTKKATKINESQGGAINKTKSPDRPKRSSNLKSTSKVSSLQQSNQVQFYDYNNKFEKVYNRPNVVRPEESCDQINAMEQAELEAQEQHTHFEELEKLRQKCDERSQKALEREQVRRDCEALTAKLDALTQGKTKTQTICDDAYLFSEARLKHLTTERQNKMNTAVENVLKRPAIITCPEVDQHSKIPISSDRIQKPSATDINVASYPKSTATGNDYNTLNSSDSCTSILLNYVNDQSKLITKDIDNCDNNEKVKKLKQLLDKINCLRIRLIDELEKANENKKKTPPDIKDVVDDISTLRRERERILLGEEKERKLEQREKKLKKNEALLERKLKEFYEMSKNNNNVESSTISSTEEQLLATESVVLSPRKLKANKPVEIIIKVKDDQSKSTGRSPYKSPSRKRSSLIQSEPKKKIKTPCKPHKPKKIAEKEVQTFTHLEDISSSTSYRSVPNEINVNLNAIIEKTTQLRQIPTATSNKCKEATEPQRTSKTAQKIPLTKPPTVPGQKTKNAFLTHYIQRLLGMSRQSIDMLGVSSSEIGTPSSSIICTPANKSTSESDICQKERLARLEKFIEDNYSFLSEVEESVKTSTSTISNDSSLKAIEEIWKRTLKRKQKEKQEKSICAALKPILKKKKQIANDKAVEREKVQSPPDKVAEQTATSKKCDDPDKIELVNKYTELTNNCTQRIAELTEMIKKVREEKQKILEITLSSATGSALSTTEYADFAEKLADKSVSKDSDHSSKIGDDMVLIEDPTGKNRLEKNKLTGISRDSGISMSRPLTALDFRESPAMQTVCTPQQESFEPLLKDIPKPDRISISTSPQTGTTIQTSAPSTQRLSETKSKKGKPPATMTRYSPQLVEDLPHELSTILEVDTSVTPRTLIASKRDKPSTILNASKADRPSTTLNVSKLLDDIDIENIQYKKFPTFEEYARMNQLDLTHFDPEISAKLQMDLEELVKMSNHVKNLKCRDEFLQNEEDSDNVQENIDNLLQSFKLLNLSVKRFPSHKEYMEKIGASQILHTQSIESEEMESSERKDTDENKSVASIDSLPDVVEELLRRNMIRQQFRHNFDGTEVRTLDGKSSSESKQSSSKNSVMENAFIEEESADKNTESKSSSPKLPIKRREEELTSGIEAIKSSSNQSNSYNIEKDLDIMGLKWASLMLKKSQQSQEIGSSSNSSSILQTSARKRSPNKQCRTRRVENQQNDSHADENLNGSSSSDASEGKPLNLREFLAKELQKRTQTSSISSTDDSLASQILRSLLGSESGNITPIQKASSTEGPTPPSSGQPNRMLTSTPVQTRTPSPSKPSTGTGSHKLFDTGSISSVRYSKSSGSESKSTNDGGNNNSNDNLTAPDVRLESDKLRNSSKKES